MLKWKSTFWIDIKKENAHFKENSNLDISQLQIWEVLKTSETVLEAGQTKPFC